MSSSYFSYITDNDMQELAHAYPDDITQVSRRLLVKKYHV